ncbi:Uncharacterised protein [Yersinia frederiksenii]|nr:Uncharacterised protein [Yersinia frederiksenii]
MIRGRDAVTGYTGHDAGRRDGQHSSIAVNGINTGYCTRDSRGIIVGKAQAAIGR